MYVITDKWIGFEVHIHSMRKTSVKESSEKGEKKSILQR